MMPRVALAAAAENTAPWGRAVLKETTCALQKRVLDVAVSSKVELENVIDRVSFLNNFYQANPFDYAIVGVLHGDAIPMFAMRKLGKNRELI